MILPLNHRDLYLYIYIFFFCCCWLWYDPLITHTTTISLWVLPSLLLNFLVCFSTLILLASHAMDCLVQLANQEKDSVGRLESLPAEDQETTADLLNLAVHVALEVLNIWRPSYSYCCFLSFLLPVIMCKKNLGKCHISISYLSHDYHVTSTSQHSHIIKAMFD